MIRKGGTMSSHIEVMVKKTEPRTVAFVAEKGSFNKIGDAIGKLYSFIQGKGYTIAGPPIGVFFNAPQEVPEEELLWEIQCSVAGEVALSEPDEQGVGIKRVEPYEVASTMHKGAYDEVGETYGALVPWIMENGYEIAGPSEEVYLSDPQNTPPEEILTEVRFPVRKS
jgi:effector-binding domain-containing protein